MKKEKEEVVVKEEAGNYGYYSKLLKKPFDTLEELKTAEDEYNKVNAEKIKLAEEKKADAKAIEESYQKAMNTRKLAGQMIQEADAEYIKLRNEFIKKYGSYHISIYDGSNNLNATVSDLFNAFFRW